MEDGTLATLSGQQMEHKIPNEPPGRIIEYRNELSVYDIYGTNRETLYPTDIFVGIATWRTPYAVEEFGRSVIVDGCHLLFGIPAIGTIIDEEEKKSGVYGEIVIYKKDGEQWEVIDRFDSSRVDTFAQEPLPVVENQQEPPEPHYSFGQRIGFSDGIIATTIRTSDGEKLYVFERGVSGKWEPTVMLYELPSISGDGFLSRNIAVSKDAIAFSIFYNERVTHTHRYKILVFRKIENE
jgi:hypothetical protein